MKKIDYFRKHVQANGCQDNSYQSGMHERPSVPGAFILDELPPHTKDTSQHAKMQLSQCIRNSCATIRVADIYEGSIIRATRRLDELLQQLARAARVVGDEGLAKHIEDANSTIRRDIIFAASLYI